MPGSGEIERLLEAISERPIAGAVGRVRSVVGLTIQADLPLCRVGALVQIRRSQGKPLLAEVVGFAEHSATLLPLDDLAGLGPDDPIELLPEPMSVACSDALLGRVLDARGAPCDGGEALPEGLPRRPVNPARRPPGFSQSPLCPLQLGVRAIDATCTLSEGGRVGLFAAPGLGKSTLLQQVCRNTEAEVVVLALIGERRREVADFVGALPAQTRKRSVILCVESDAPPLGRMRAAEAATTLAEDFAERGRKVLLMMDSITRYARAARDVGLAAGELPARRGYPPSVFAALPRLLERAGPRGTGSVTALYSVLVEADALDDPIADELQGLLDGHVLLRRDLAEQGHFPAIDVVSSLSRLMPRIVDLPHLRLAQAMRRDLALYQEHRDLVAMGAYEPGTHRELDEVLARIGAIRTFLTQQLDEEVQFEAAVRILRTLYERR